MSESDQDSGRHTDLSATVIERETHCIHRDMISEHAISVLQKLKAAGYSAFLVGGCVRDLMLGREPKDFDVVTDATPEQIQKVFNRCRIIGRRFRLAHIMFGRTLIEVATFRGSGDETETRMTDEGRILRDNVYGSIEDDAIRRDFSVNAMYYDIDTGQVLDFVNGYEDLKAGRLRLIGDPEKRYREDPVRMLRAIRFAAKLGFRIDEGSESPLLELGPLLGDISPSRLFEETRKLFLSGAALATFELLRHYNLFTWLFAETEEALEHEEEGFPLTLISIAMRNTDTRVSEDKPVTPAFLYAVFLWEPVRQRAHRIRKRKQMSKRQALVQAASEINSLQAKQTSIPRRFSQPMKEIWTMQPWFEQQQGNRAMRLLEHPRFRAAYDFLLLRAEVGEAEKSLADWWTEIQLLDEQALAEKLKPSRGKQGGKRRPRRRQRQYQ